MLGRPLRHRQGAFGRGQQAVDLLAGAGQGDGVAPELLDHPRQAGGGGVFAGQQHGEHIAGHVLVAHAAVGGVGGHQHRLQQVLRRGTALRRLQAHTGLGHEVADGAIDQAHALVERTVARQLDDLPVRHQGVGASPDGGEDFVEVALDDVVVGLQGVDVNPEGQAGDGVHREAHQVGLQVDVLGAFGGLVCRVQPARAQAVRHVQQRREVGAHLLRRKAGHDHAALAGPVLTLGHEDAIGDAHLPHDGLHARGPAEGLGAFAQQLADEVGVGHHHHVETGQAHLHQRAMDLDPVFHVLVHAVQADLQGVAHHGPGWRPGQVAEPAGRGLGADSCGLRRFKCGVLHGDRLCRLVRRMSLAAHASGLSSGASRACR